MESLNDIKDRSPIDRAFVILTALAGMEREYIDRVSLKELGVSAVKYMVLTFHASQNDKVKLSDIAQFTSTRTHNVTTLITRMIRDGLVTTKRNEKNRTIVNVYLTDKGHDIYESTKDKTRNINNQVMKGISNADALELERMLLIILGNIKSASLE